MYIGGEMWIEGERGGKNSREVERRGERGEKSIEV